MAKTVSFALNKLGWKPRTEREQVWYDLALEDWSRLKANAASTRKVLLNDLEGHDAAAAERAACALIAMGIEDAVPALIAALKHAGTEHMARIYWIGRF